MKYAVELRGYSFKARHAVGFPQNVDDPDGQWFCEDLHWHEFHVAAKLSGPTDVACCVVDFRVADAALKEVLAKLDGATILPSRSFAASFSRVGDEIVVQYDAESGPRVAKVPVKDVVWMLWTNPTAEKVAEGLLRAWLERLEFYPDKKYERYSASLTLEEETNRFVEVEMDADEVAEWKEKCDENRNDGKTLTRFAWRGEPRPDLLVRRASS